MSSEYSWLNGWGNKCMGVIYSKLKCMENECMELIFCKLKYMVMICSKPKCFGNICFQNVYFENEYSEVAGVVMEAIFRLQGPLWDPRGAPARDQYVSLRISISCSRDHL
jgi:hypothetical protein